MTDLVKRVAIFYAGWRLPFILLFAALVLVGLSIDAWWSAIIALLAAVPLLVLYALTASRVGDQEAKLLALSERLDAAEQLQSARAGNDEAATTEALDVVFVPDNAWHASSMVDAADELGHTGAAVAMLDTGELASSGGSGPVLASNWAGRTIGLSEFATSVAPHVVVAQWPYGAAVSSVIEIAESMGALTVELTTDPAEIDRLDEAPSGRCQRTVTSARELRWVVAGRSPRVRDSIDLPALLPVTPFGAKEEESGQRIDRDDIASFAGRHEGERCVIIGNGPSLNDLDLSLLRGETTVGVNSIFLADSIDFPLSYYVVEDSLVMKENLEAIKEYRAGYKFFPSIYREIYEAAPVGEGSLGGVSYFNMNGGFYLGQSPNFCVPRFSTDASQRLYCGQSVTIVNLQLAYYMGFSEVYVIGMDFSYTIPETSEIEGNHILSTGDDPNHFHKDYFGKGKTWKDPKLDRVLNNYQLAKVMFEADGRSIYNATAGGMLELFERRDFHDVFGS